MPNTVREEILQDIKTELSEISVANGFDNNIQSVSQWDPNGIALQAVPRIVITLGSESNDDDAYDLTTCRLTVYITVYSRIDEGSATAADTALNSLLGDIKKKLKEDITRGGKAVDTKFLEVETFESVEGQGEVGLIITTEVHYRHQQTNPKTVR